MSTTDHVAIVVAGVKLDGSEISEGQYHDLVHLRVSRHLGSVGHAEIRFRDLELEYSTTFAPGKRITVTHVNGDTEVSVFEGDITAIGVDVDVDGIPTIVVEALDDARKLGNKISLSSELNTKASDIISSIAGDAGLTPDVTVTREVFDQVEVLGTPLQFLDMLASRYGYVWYVDGRKLVVKPRQSSGAVEVAYGEDLLDFAGRVSTTGLPTTVEVRAWDPKEKQSIVGTASVTHSSGINVPAAQSGALESDLKLTVIRAGVPTQSEANNVAAGIAARIAAMLTNGSGHCLARAEIVPGGQVELKNMGSAWSGKYHVTGVEHTFGASTSLITRFTVGSDEAFGLSGMLGGGSGVTSERDVTSGISIGIVTDINDPNGQGRVKVNLPNVGDEHETFWARVVSPGAGVDRGLLTMPEVNDEVAVVFENGDVQRPYVLGGLWNGKDAQPSNHTIIEDGKVAVRSITSRGGAYIALSEDKNDSAGERYIDVVTADAGASLHVGEDEVKIAAPALPITLQNEKAEIKILDSGEIQITAKQGNLKIDGKHNDVEISGMNVTIKGTQGVTVEGPKIDVKGSSMVTVDAGTGIAAVKGSMVNLN